MLEPTDADEKAEAGVNLGPHITHWYTPEWELNPVSGSPKPEQLSTVPSQSAYAFFYNPSGTCHLAILFSQEDSIEILKSYSLKSFSITIDTLFL